MSWPLLQFVFRHCCDALHSTAEVVQQTHSQHAVEVIQTMRLREHPFWESFSQRVAHQACACTKCASSAVAAAATV
eukprot:13206-Heterococcus_DN1.PRE.9